MDHNDFEKDLKRLRRIFKPRGFDETTKAEYWRLVQDWKSATWEHVVSRAIDEGTYFPSPKELRGYAGITERPGKSQAGQRPDGCENCFEGLIPFDAEHNGRLYERVAACDCPAGQWWMKINRKFGRMKTASEMGIQKGDRLRHPISRPVE